MQLPQSSCTGWNNSNEFQGTSQRSLSLPMRSMSHDGSHTVIMKQELLNAKRTISELKVVNTCLKKDKLKAEHERNLI